MNKTVVYSKQSSTVWKNHTDFIIQVCKLFIDFDCIDESQNGFKKKKRDEWHRQKPSQLVQNKNQSNELWKCEMLYKSQRK